jgi:hypothetical protein
MAATGSTSVPAAVPTATHASRCMVLMGPTVEAPIGDDTPGLAGALTVSLTLVRRFPERCAAKKFVVLREDGTQLAHIIVNGAEKLRRLVVEWREV